MIILASQSQIRKQILSAAGVLFTAQTSPLDEKSAKLRHRHNPPDKLASTLAREKAIAVSILKPLPIVIAADQTLSLERTLFNKPQNTAEAKAHLQRLRGHTHSLHSAIAVTQGTDILFEYIETAELTMRNFSDAFLNDYLETSRHDIIKSVGCYQLEGPGINLFDRIHGDYFSILGLPLLPLLAFLREIGELKS